MHLYFFQGASHSQAISQLVKPLVSTVKIDVTTNQLVVFLPPGFDLPYLETVMRGAVETFDAETKMKLLHYFEATETKPVLVETKDSTVTWTRLRQVLMPRLMPEPFSLAKFKELSFEGRRDYLRGLDVGTICDDDVCAIVRILAQGVAQLQATETVPILQAMMFRYAGENILHPMSKAFFMESASDLCEGVFEGF